MVYMLVSILNRSIDYDTRLLKNVDGVRVRLIFHHEMIKKKVYMLTYSRSVLDCSCRRAQD